MTTTVRGTGMITLTRRHLLCSLLGSSAALLVSALLAPPGLRPARARGAAHRQSAATPTTAPVVVTLPWPAPWARQVTEPVELAIAHSWDPAQQQVQNRFDQSFMQRHPNIKLNVTYTPWGEYQAKWLPQAAAGTLPDIMYMDDTWVQAWIRRGLAIELTPLIESDPAFEFDRIVKNSLGPGMYQGKLYAIPYGWVGRALGYNKELFDKAGIKYPDESWTYETLREAARALTIPGKQWGFYVHGWASWPFHGDFLVPFGGAVVNEDETEVLIATSESVQAIQWWGDFVMKDQAALGEWQVGPGTASGIQGHPFPQGKVAMAPWASWYTGDWLKQNPDLLEQADVALYPTGPARRAAAACDSRFIISSQSKKVDAAWTYLREYLSARGMAEVFALPAYDWTSRPESQEYYLKGPNLPPGAKRWLEMVNNYGVTCLPISAQASEMTRIIKERFADFWAGTVDAQGVATAIAQELEPLAAKNRG